MLTNSVFEIRIKKVQIPNEMGLNVNFILNGRSELVSFPTLFADKISCLVKYIYTRYSLKIFLNEENVTIKAMSGIYADTSGVTYEEMIL